APPGVEGVILRCLEKDPVRRYANVAELANALAEFAPVRARVSIDRVSRIAGTPGVAPTIPERDPARTAPPQVAPPPMYSTAYTPLVNPRAPMRGLAPPYAPHPAFVAAPPPPREGMHPALIVLLTIAALCALGFGGCMLCVCATAATGRHPELPSDGSIA